MNRIKITDDMKEEIVKMYTKHKMKQKEIAEHFGIAQARVSLILKERGVGVYANKLDISKVINMYESGMTQTEIAQKLKTAQANISIILKDNNIKIRRRIYIDRSKVVSMYVKHKMKQIDIAREFNVSQATISKILKSYAITK